MLEHIKPLLDLFDKYNVHMKYHIQIIHVKLVVKYFIEMENRIKLNYVQ